MFFPCIYLTTLYFWCNSNFLQQEGRQQPPGALESSAKKKSSRIFFYRKSIKNLFYITLSNLSLVSKHIILPFEYQRYLCRLLHDWWQEKVCDLQSLLKIQQNDQEPQPPPFMFWFWFIFTKGAVGLLNSLS